MRRAAGFVLAVGLGVSGFATVQAESNVQFSGQAVQSSPDGKSRTVQMYVGDNQVRLEHGADGQAMVEINDFKNRRVLLLVPDKKEYMQRELPQSGPSSPMLPPKDSNPCVALPDAQCKKLGTESLFGRPVVQWEVTVESQGKQLRSLHWIDDQRHMSLRDVWPDGATTESILEGTESLDGRTTERWRRTTTTPDGKQQTTTQWYDPELQISVREELPGGYFREITNIRVAPQAPGLFQVPAGYRRVEGDNPAVLQKPAPRQPDSR
jgi:hypothetical protein